MQKKSFKYYNCAYGLMRTLFKIPLRSDNKGSTVLYNTTGPIFVNLIKGNTHKTIHSKFKNFEYLLLLPGVVLQRRPSSTLPLNRLSHLGQARSGLEEEEVKVVEEEVKVVEEESQTPARPRRKDCI